MTQHAESISALSSEQVKIHLLQDYENTVLKI